MKELGRSVGLLGAQRAAVLLLGAVRTKIVATVLGPAGLGLLSQASSLVELLRQVANVGTGRGFLRLVAEQGASGDTARLERLILTAGTLVGLLSGILAASCVGFAPAIAAGVFGDAGRAPLVTLCGLILVASVPGAMAGRILNGLLDFRAYGALMVAQSLAGVVAMALLAPRAGLAGGVAAFLAAEVVGAGLGFALLRRRVLSPLGLSLRPRAPDLESLRRLLRYAGALSVTSLAAAGAALLVRTDMLVRLGPEANGLYQVAWQVGQNYLGILAASLWSYGMPKIASHLEDAEAIGSLQNDFLCIALALLAPGILILLVSREFWVPILFSVKFLGAGPILAWQLSGELGSVLRQSMNISLLPRERLRFLVLQGVAYWGAWAALSWILVPRLGALSAAVAYCVVNALMLVVSFAYHHRVLGFRLRPDSRALLWRTLPLFAVGVALSLQPGPMRFTPLAVLAIWLLLSRRFLVRLRDLV